MPRDLGNERGKMETRVCLLHALPNVCALNNQTGRKSRMSKHFQGQEDTIQGDKQNHLVRAIDLYPNYQLTPTLQVLRNLATQSRPTSFPG